MENAINVIQTLNGFDGSIKSYSISPISTEEENPIAGFGPIGRINIFVGATNSGKSRFLRGLAKNLSFTFYNSERLKQSCLDLKRVCKELASEEGAVRLNINSQGRNFVGGYPEGMGNYRPWVRELLGPIDFRKGLHKIHDSRYFARLLQSMDTFLSHRFSQQTFNSSAMSFDKTVFPEDLVMCSLLKRENEAREEDERILKSKPNSYIDLNSIARINQCYNNLPIQVDATNFHPEWEEKYLQFWNIFSEITEQIPLVTVNPKRIYIPVLRSAVSLRDEDGARIKNDIFESTVKKNYGMAIEGLEIFTGNSLYSILDNNRRGSRSTRLQLEDFEVFLSSNFFEDQPLQLIASSELDAEGDASHIVVSIGSNDDRQLHNLGDGINTLIILLYKVFMAEKGSWIFIEEPELNLHPGLQRVFLQTILENEALRALDLHIFFTTHSNHLLKMTLKDGSLAEDDISIFSFQKRSEDGYFHIRPLVSEHHHALALLGVQNASVLLAQCGIWVEGPTDRYYLRAYLKAYMDHLANYPDSVDAKREKVKFQLREDNHYAFWEYAGSLISHYLFGPIPRSKGQLRDQAIGEINEILQEIQSSALCNRIFLLADKDSSYWKQQKHQKLRAIASQTTNFYYCVTPGTEVENLLSEQILRASLPHLFTTQSTTVTQADLNGVTFNTEDYVSKGLGAFLKEKFRTHCPDALPTTSGTLSTYYKNRLAKEAIKHVTWESMSKDAKDVTRQLYKFLVEHNNI